MRSIRLKDGSDLAAWRTAARTLLAEGVPPEQVQWQIGERTDLFGGSEPAASPPAAVASTRRVPRGFLDLADTVLAHSDPRRHAVLYRMLWRLVHGEHGLLALASDDDVAWAALAAKAVRRDMHKMKAFVRFREVTDPAGSVFVAWFEPSHDIVARVAPFFVRRFVGMRWSILTPSRSAHWDGGQLTLGNGADKRDAPAGDALEDLWRTYFANIFNPARLKVRAMKQEMPVRYWKNLPEAALIPGLARDAAARMQAMVEQAPTVPARRIPAPIGQPAAALAESSIGRLREQARHCRNCPLWQPATQLVFGEGDGHARVVVIGEQPDDHDDLAGRPFSGAMGELFDQALALAGIDRAALYITLAVKHFRFAPDGKQRLPLAASAGEQAACRPWLMAELDQLRPRAIVCIGSMAAKAIFGRGFNLTERRGRWVELAGGMRAFATVTPSSLLRIRGDTARNVAWQRFVDELGLMREMLA